MILFTIVILMLWLNREDPLYSGVERSFALSLLAVDLWVLFWIDKLCF